jgi:hypothetical protein
MIMKHFFTLLLVFLLKSVSWAQCCSPGNPVGGTANVGTLDARTLRVLAFLRHSYSDTYFEGSKKAEFQGTTAGYYYFGSVLAYGITPRLTAETELGLFLDKRKTNEGQRPEQTSGLANGVFSIKYGVWKDAVREWEFTAGAGIRFPFSKKLALDDYDYPLSMDVQSSTGAFGFIGQLFLYKGFLSRGWRLFLLNRFEKNAANNIGYDYGDALTSAFFASRKINLHWTGILQLRNEYRKIDIWEGVKLNSTGGELVTLSPQINYTIAQKWNISLLMDIPLYRHYNLAQLGSKYAFAVNVVRDFKLSQKMEVH